MENEHFHAFKAYKKPCPVVLHRKCISVTMFIVCFYKLRDEMIVCANRQHVTDSVDRV